jgi:prolyl-tRNA synthetase
MMLSIKRHNALRKLQASFKILGLPGARAVSSSKALFAASTAISAPDSRVITPRSTDYSAWYTDVIKAADMIDSSPVRGCMVIKPYGMATWDLLKKELDYRITESGTDNAYFPLFIPMSFLAKESEHIDGFAKECAVVTHHRLKIDNSNNNEMIVDPDAKLEEPLVVRPTSETMIWHMFSKWISSHRDLPLKINQWANVVRWEMRPRPFLRNAEFLWQEGHTAHATKEEAIITAKDSLDMYASVCEDMLAIPVIKGVKSPIERFAGAIDTYTIEALMQNGWALQSGTSHFLGQNFAKAFDVYYNDENSKRELVWATSWGVSTRLMGALIMTHSDDKGLIMPPAVAPYQVVIVPIMPEKDENIMKKINRITKNLKSAGIRVKIDSRASMRPGAKYYEWERKGVPIRLDIGPKDSSKNIAVMTIRHNNNKLSISISNNDNSDDNNDLTFTNEINEILKNIQIDLFNKAKNRLNDKIFIVNKYDEMKKIINNDDIKEKGFYLVPWKCNNDNEEYIKTDCKATIRCYPFVYNEECPGNDVKCFYSGDQATHYALFARAF